MTGDPLLTIWLQQHLAEVYMRLDDYALAAQHLEQALDLAQMYHYPPPAACVLMDLAQAWFLMGNGEKGAALLPETQRLAEQLCREFPGDSLS